MQPKRAVPRHGLPYMKRHETRVLKTEPGDMTHNFELSEMIQEIGKFRSKIVSETKANIFQVRLLSEIHASTSSGQMLTDIVPGHFWPDFASRRTSTNNNRKMFRKRNT